MGAKLANQLVDVDDGSIELHERDTRPEEGPGPAGRGEHHREGDHEEGRHAQVDRQGGDEDGTATDRSIPRLRSRSRHGACRRAGRDVRYRAPLRLLGRLDGVRQLLEGEADAPLVRRPHE